MQKFINSKTNFFIIFAGAICIILLTKALTGFLPSKYYFSFSDLTVGGSEPMIVEPPGITGQKLCEILRKHNLPLDALDNRSISCKTNFKGGFVNDTAGIQSIAMHSDRAVRDAFQQLAARVHVQPLQDDAALGLIKAAGDPKRAYDDIIQYYDQQLFPTSDAGLGTAIGTLYAPYVKATADDTPEDDTPAVSPEDQANLLKANRDLFQKLSALTTFGGLLPIKPYDIQQIIEDDEGDVGVNIFNFYHKQLSDHLTALAQQSLAPSVPYDTAAIFKDASTFSWQDYALACLFRLVPVSVFGFCLGVLLGRVEVVSIGLAGGMAAFLLSWPMMLLWDTLVKSKFNDERATFFALYAVYVLSFFFVARSAGLFGAWLCEQELLGLSAPASAAGNSRVRVRDLAVNAAGAACLTTAAYGWNFLVPLGR